MHLNFHSVRLHRQKNVQIKPDFVEGTDSLISSEEVKVHDVMLSDDVTSADVHVVFEPSESHDPDV